MKKIVVVWMVLLMVFVGWATMAVASDKVDKVDKPAPTPIEWMDGPENCYRYAMVNDTLIVQTAQQLTIKKDYDGTVRTAEEVNKVCNDLGKSVYTELLKIYGVARVFVTVQEIAITRSPFPKKWDDLLPVVLARLDDFGEMCVGEGKEGEKSK
jgi:hypothetical protein